MSPHRFETSTLYRSTFSRTQVIALLRQWLIRRGRVALQNMHPTDRVLAPLITDLAEATLKDPGGLEEVLVMRRPCPPGPSASGRPALLWSAHP